jgi:hypothetical protein
MRYLLIILLLTACGEPKPKCTEKQMQDYRDLTMQCLDKTKSSVTNANDDEDTDDTIYACHNVAAELAGISDNTFRNCER